MKAVHYSRYGSPEVIRAEDADVPVPGENDVLISVHAASVNAYDWHVLTADIFLVRFMGGGFLKPNDPRLGTDVAGVVDAVGSGVSEFNVGDRVFGMVKGGFAEYACAPARAFAPMPVNATFELAAAVPLAGITALQGLRDAGGITPGQRVLVNGASGGVGTFAVQIAKSYDTEVTAVCSTRNVQQAREIGADHVIDYTCEDFTSNGVAYDLVFAANGFRTLSAYRRSLSPRGVFVMAGGTPAQNFQSMLFGSLMSEKGGRKMTGFMARNSRDDLMVLKNLYEEGAILPVIDRRYPLEEAASAMEYLGQGHARGKVIIHVER